MNNTIKMEVASNGIIVTYKDDTKKTIVYELEDQDNIQYFYRLMEMFRDIEDFSGIIYGKRSKYVLEMKIKHGYDYECNDKNCTICKKVGE